VVVGLGVISHYVHCFNVIPSSVIPNLALRKVPLSIQDEHANAMEDRE
jgi:hypothetical protein